MKTTLKFLLSISNTKMVVLNNAGKQSCYVAHKENPLGINHNFDKIANCITGYE